MAQNEDKTKKPDASPKAGGRVRKTLLQRAVATLEEGKNVVLCFKLKRRVVASEVVGLK